MAAEDFCIHDPDYKQLSSDKARLSDGLTELFEYARKKADLSGMHNVAELINRASELAINRNDMVLKGLVRLDAAVGLAMLDIENLKIERHRLARQLGYSQPITNNP